MNVTISVKFNDSGRKAQEKPNPKFPNGTDVSCAPPGRAACCFNVPYPAPGCGTYSIVCDDCKFTALVTVAGRSDDPRTVTLPCKNKVH